MMPGVQFEDIWKALCNGYSSGSLQRMLKFRLDRILENIVASGSKEDMLFELLERAEREGWTTDLVREAYRFNPGNGDLLRIYEKYGLAPAVSGQQAGRPLTAVRSVSQGLERTIRDRLPALDFAVWREKMTLVEGRVCRVEIGGNAAGTGFLVGPDAVLTNYHVLQSVLEGKTAPGKVTCRFDYKVLANGTRVEGVSARGYSPEPVSHICCGDLPCAHARCGS
jgi:hypothetical protein